MAAILCTDKACMRTKILCNLSAKDCLRETLASPEYLKDRLTWLWERTPKDFCSDYKQLPNRLLLKYLLYQRMHLPASAQSENRNCHQKKILWMHNLKAQQVDFHSAPLRNKMQKSLYCSCSTFTLKADLSNSPAKDGFVWIAKHFWNLLCITDTAWLHTSILLSIFCPLSWALFKERNT